MIDLPKMTVEQRESMTAHSVPAPSENLTEQLSEAIVLNMDSARGFLSEKGHQILSKYISPYVEYSKDRYESAIMEVMKLYNWQDVSNFVKEDDCTEFFIMARKYCQTQGQKHKREKDFIDGSGIGYTSKYLRDLKPVLEKCFDAKYFYKISRPIEFSLFSFGIDLTQVANHLHPGHWSYPAGHGTKFLQVVETLNDIYHLDTHCYEMILLAACIASMGRSGNLIHYPSDNLAGGYLTNLKEFKK